MNFRRITIISLMARLSFLMELSVRGEIPVYMFAKCIRVRYGRLINFNASRVKMDVSSESEAF